MKSVRWHGACDGGFASGQGTFEISDIWVEVRGEGEFVAGKMQGRGFYSYNRRARIEGEFRNGSLNGRGIKTLYDGERYDGSWKEGKESGYGVHTWPDGARFEGEWKSGYPDGPGLYLFPNGKILKADWGDFCDSRDNPELFNLWQHGGEVCPQR